LVDRTEQFQKLVADSKWTPAQLAERLEVSEASISQYINGKTDPPRPLLKLFRILLDEPMVMREESGGREEIELWKRRAKNAEQQIANLRNGLRRLLDQAGDTPKERVSSTRTSDAGALAKKAAGDS